MRFVLIDRIDRLEVGRRAQGHKQIAPDEDYFRDHFPGYPIVPGVLVVESLAQLGGRLIDASVREASGRKVLPVLAKIDRARFSQPVRPGDRLDLSVDLVAVGDDVARVTGAAHVRGSQVASAALMYALIDPTREDTGPGRAGIQAFSEWSDRIWQDIWAGSDGDAGEGT